MTKSLDVVILTFNEERNLPACLESLREVSDQVFVVDSGSTDSTQQIAASFGCHIHSHAFSTHAEQWAWALENLPLRGEWVLALDADQRLSPELKTSIGRFLLDATPSIEGAYLNRRQVFRGRWIRFGGYYPKYLLKLFRRSAVTLGRDLVDHHFVVAGKTVKLQGDMIEANQNEDEIFTWIAKHNRYAVLQAREEISRGSEVGVGRLTGTPDERTAWLKSVWRRLPLYLRPFFYFSYRYVLRLGILDGKQGFVFHFLQAFWYRLLVDINIDQQRRTSRSTQA
jgi:glycosyltransferase involved in cell wall biosynthesis